MHFHQFVVKCKSFLQSIEWKLYLKNLFILTHFDEFIEKVSDVILSTHFRFNWTFGFGFLTIENDLLKVCFEY